VTKLLKSAGVSSRRGLLYVTAAIVIVAPPIVWLLSSIPASRPAPPPSTVRLAADPAPALRSDLEELARRDPMALVRLGREFYDRHVREYRCLLTKQELLGDKLSEVQEIELRFREQPFAVYMLWRSNADEARRALFMRGGDFLDDQGRALARVEPNGAIARLFVRDIFMPIHGPEARRVSRRSIDEAGFRATFDLLETYNAVAAERGVLDLRYGGRGVIDGRPTYILVRDLPYDGPNGPYPDARMVLHLDAEWLLPVAVYSYADHEEKQLLGSYLFTQIELNPGFDEDDFRF